MRAGRVPDAISLVAVTKYAQLEWVKVLLELGVVDLGENRPQQLLERAEQLTDSRAAVRWHLIGHLQRNKVRRTLPAVALIHSVDSLRLLRAINDTACELQLSPTVMLELNLTREPQKHGFQREELLAGWDEVLEFQNVRVRGLMAMASYADDPEASRPTFAALRELRDTLASRSAGRLDLPDLSMGMTGDFEVAIEEGATIVRVGSALWEGAEAETPEAAGA